MSQLADVSNVPFEKKDEVMKLIKKGKTLGEVKKQVGLTLYEVMDILSENITTVHMFTTKTVGEK